MMHVDAVTHVFASVEVQDPSQVPSARSLAARAAHDAGLSTVELDRIALAATELATNLYLHAIGGELLVGHRPAGDAETAGRVTLIAVDRGPGVQRFDRCLVDGYSTAGTMGTGLGAVRRLAANFDAVSEPGRGTIVVAEFLPPGSTPRPSAFDVAVVGLPISGETVNGDGCAMARRGPHLYLMLADGLGHGPLAAQASSAAAAAFPQLVDQPVTAVVSALNERLTGTRGAAVSAVSLSLDAARDGGELRTCGLGNVSVLVAGPDGSTKRVASANGTAGAGPAMRTREQTAPFPPRGTVLLHTDGLTSRWTLDGRAELLRHGAQVVAAALWRDHARGRDDAMVLVAKARPVTETADA